MAQNPQTQQQVEQFIKNLGNVMTSLAREGLVNATTKTGRQIAESSRQNFKDTSGLEQAFFGTPFQKIVQSEPFRQLTDAVDKDYINRMYEIENRRSWAENNRPITVDEFYQNILNKRGQGATVKMDPETGEVWPNETPSVPDNITIDVSEPNEKGGDSDNTRLVLDNEKWDIGGDKPNTTSSSSSDFVKNLNERNRESAEKLLRERGAKYAYSTDGKYATDLETGEVISADKARKNEEDNSDTIEYTYKRGDTFGQVIKDLGLKTDKGLWGSDGDVAYYTKQLRQQGIPGMVPIGTKIRLKRRK